MKSFNLTNIDGEYYADSRDVAEVIERPHKDLLKTIRTYCEYLTEGENSPSEFFVNGEYNDSTSRKLPCYLITKKGCDMIANKLNGKKGVLFTAAYVSAFEQMKEQLEMQSAAIQHFPTKATSAGEISSLIKNVRIAMERQNSAAVKIARQTELLLKHFGLPVIEGFVEKSPYEQTSLLEV